MSEAREIMREKNLPLPELDDWESVWRILDEHGRKDFLYAIADNKNKLVKFGRSVNPKARLKTLKTGNALTLHLCGYCRNESPLSETEVHRRLAEHRISGEWFRLNEHTESVIKEIRRTSMQA